ncbi:YrhB domain-containing protein [Streptomyces europaeiscabiei]|uniref:YrhB domain-containing protein n=1 Tax=Streptomyces europaeiscabiei TaxID=146819 RepID=A0ABU4NT57_9ACTN|nr:YrhB domain-containing protein [Streptomyces europaeiscabiei]MDX2524749.1 YrhB domain-containing protein [Streptomyces europaeiscabiei]MDX2758500.1 YrhB domain-containing protein [Streptomyces europaeiscabiei]MDX2771781.1 YrhB domain-containing protein [Streptomyces europaeiscabiei]MDX3548344.1 YrhB domain-containing protein [Streptomyces europaeiscabiei]MDX3558904.1 YrhB domain-containing protein [Streptomyces europaeiscabiei]
MEAQLERESQGQLRVTHVEEHELVWVVAYQSAEYLRTGDPSRMLVGGGPFLVDRVARPCCTSPPSSQRHSVQRTPA